MIKGRGPQVGVVSKPRGIRWVKGAGATVAVLLLLMGCHLVYLQYGNNFHVISPGVAYRSAQMNEAALEACLSGYGIRSVINLRGKSPGEAWYDREKATCSRRNVALYDLKLSAKKEPSPVELDELLRIFREAPRPVLIHCKAGADRSGLASALWKVTMEGVPKSEAGSQLSIRYGHMPLGPTTILDRFFERWEPGGAFSTRPRDLSGLEQGTNGRPMDKGRDDRHSRLGMEGGRETDICPLTWTHTFCSA
jgi:hypothetical protein